MPHIIVKLYPGKSQEQKFLIAEKLTEALIEAVGSARAAISVGVEEIDPADWEEKVGKPDIAGKRDRIYKMPG